MYKIIIIKLVSLTRLLKAIAIKQQENRIIMAGDSVHSHILLAEKRYDFALSVQDTLKKRADNQLMDGLYKANKSKIKAKRCLDELNNIN